MLQIKAKNKAVKWEKNSPREADKLLENDVEETSQQKETGSATGSPNVSIKSNDTPLDENDTLGSLGEYPRAVRHLARQSSSESNFSVRSLRSCNTPLHVSISHLGPNTTTGQKFTVFNYGSQDITQIPSSPAILSPSQTSRSPLFPATPSVSRPSSAIWMNQEQGSQPDGYSMVNNGNFQNSIGYRNNRVIFKQNSRISRSNSEAYEVLNGFPNRIGDEGQQQHDCFINIPDDSLPDKFASITAKVAKKVSVFEIIKRGRLFAKRRKDRLFKKSGDKNINFINVSKRRRKYIQDLFTTLIDTKWRYLILMFILAFLITWIGFAIVWFTIATFDKAYEAYPNSTDTERVPCVVGVTNFATAVLFSIETQHTIGYGTRAVTDQCPVAIIFIMCQSLVGVALTCIITGLFFAKFARPKRRAETILFSKHAVICEHDGRRCLMFRVGDMRQSHMISVNITGILVETHLTSDGETLPYFQHNLHIRSEAEDLFFMAWPIKAIHYIDETSPLWKLSSEDLLEADFEIVIIYVGTNSSTGQTMQVVTSYLPSEIMWGHKLDTLLTAKSDIGRYTVDYCRFNETSHYEMSERSAYEESLWKTHMQNIAASEHSDKRESAYSPYDSYSVQNNGKTKQCV